MGNRRGGPRDRRAASRVRTLAWLVLFAAVRLVWSPPPATAADAFPASFTDAAGRSVTVSAEPRRIVLGEGLQFLALSLLHPRPAEALVLWGDDLKAYDASTYQSLAAAFPDLAAVPVIGTRSGGLSLETILSAEPDLVVLSLWQQPTAGLLVAQLDAAGVPVVFVDFFEAPLRNTQASMIALGAAIGQSGKAKAFVDLYAGALAEIDAALGGMPPERPKTFLQAFPGLWPCCWSAGSGGLGAFLDLAKADNIGAARFPTDTGGNVNAEFLLSEDPVLYIGTGLSDRTVGGGLVIGTGIDAATARESLARVAALPGIASLSAARTGRVHGIWNYLNGSPLNILAIEAFATWAHPGIAGRIDPQRTLDRLNAKFFAAPLVGTFWVSLAAGGETGRTTP